MKKIVALFVCVLLLVGCIIPASAAKNSPEIDDVISNVFVSDKSGNTVNGLRLRRQGVVNDKLKPTNQNERVIAGYDIDKTGDISYPVTVNLDIAGIKKNSKLYALALSKDGSVKKIEVKILSDGKVSFVLDKEYDSISFIADKATASVGTSDKTGSNIVVYVFAFMMFAATGVVFAGSKIKAN